MREGERGRASEKERATKREREREREKERESERVRERVKPGNLGWQKIQDIQRGCNPVCPSSPVKTQK